MKKLVSIILICVMIVSCALLSGCGKNAAAYDYNLDEYITLPDYNNFKVDKDSNDYKMGLLYQNYSNLKELDDVITETELTKGTVEILDIANIDYVGRKNGVAFEGGTAKGQELQIGSSSFIEGFESGLIGVKIGDTVDLNLTFPENYGSEELAGAEVVFTVTVNSVKRPVISEITTDIAKSLGYSSADEYNTSVDQNYLKNYLWNDFVNSTEITKYPEKEVDSYIELNMDQLKQQAEASGTTVEQMLSSYGMTEEDYRKQLEPYANSYVAQCMIAYSISRKENLIIEDTDVDEYIQTNYAGRSITDEERQNIKESMLIEEVIVFLASKAK